MAGVGRGSSLTAVALGRATGRYEKGARDRSILHGRRHKWASRALLGGGLLLGLVLLPDILKPPLLLFSFLWMLNGGINLRIDIGHAPAKDMTGISIITLC